MIMVTGINDLDLLKKKKLDKTLSVRLEWVATQSSVVAASDWYTRNCSDIESTSGGGEHERGYRHSGKRIRVDLSRENFWYMVASICIFNAFWARISAFLGWFGTGGNCISVMEHWLRTNDTVSGLRKVMHANLKHFIHTVPTGVGLDSKKSIFSRKMRKDTKRA